jgi:hypothetical protein
MGKTGTWSLSPAHDMSFLHNPGPDKWTRQLDILPRLKGGGFLPCYA